MRILFLENETVARYRRIFLQSVSIMVMVVINNVVQADNVLGQAKVGSSASVMVFVSLSMPEPSLQKMARQAAQIDAPLLLYGLKENSLKKTVAELHRVLGDKANVLIDPERFNEFEIDKVPAVVLMQGERFDIVYGDQSLQSALWQIQTKGELKGEAEAIRSSILHGQSYVQG